MLAKNNSNIENEYSDNTTNVVSRMNTAMPKIGPSDKSVPTPILNTPEEVSVKRDMTTKATLDLDTKAALSPSSATSDFSSRKLHYK